MSNSTASHITLRAAGLALLAIVVRPAVAQQLPPGPQPMPELRRGANGEIEVAPSSSATGAPAAARPTPAPPPAPVATRPLPAARTVPATQPANPPAAKPEPKETQTNLAPSTPPAEARPAASEPAPSKTTATFVAKHYQLSPDKLPPPGTTKPGDLEPTRVQRGPTDWPVAPPEFAVSMFARNVGDARWLCVAPNGDVFLADSGNGKIMMLRDDGTGVAKTITTFAAGFTEPHGMAFHNGFFYVADVNAVWRIPYRDGDQTASDAPVRVTKSHDLRPAGEHRAREIAFGRDGALFLAIGAAEDVSDNDPPPDATIQEIDAKGAMSTFASGLRNAVGLAVDPATGDLWGTVNERDRLGGDLPPDYLARIGKGDFFGWPYAYVGPHADPVYGSKHPDLVSKTKVPEILFEPHSAPNAVVFYTGTQYPADYANNAFVALHASGPYDHPDGYKVVRVKFANGQAVAGYDDFVTGFMQPGSNPPHVWGTPAGLAIAKDGSLLIADESVVWRVTYKGKR